MLADGRTGDTVAQGVYKPESEAGEDAGVSEEVEVGALGEDHDAVVSHGLDVLLVNDGGALADDGAV